MLWPTHIPGNGTPKPIELETEPARFPAKPFARMAGQTRRTRVSDAVLEAAELNAKFGFEPWSGIELHRMLLMKDVRKFLGL